MTRLLDTIDFTLDCPQCGQQIKEKLGRLHRDRHITCRRCGRLALQVDTLAKIGRAIKEIERQTANLAKAGKIKL